MSLGSDPPPPTAGIGAAQQVAAAQQPYNTAAQRSSMVNQQGPYGSLNYVQTGTTPQGTPIYTAKNQLNPQQQQLLNQLVGTQTTAGGAAGELLAGAGYGSESPAKAIGDMASGLTGQGMTQGLSFLKPFFDTQTSQLDTQLRNQGLTPGNPAYDVAMRQVQTNQGLQVNQMMESLFPTEQQFAMKEYQLPAQMATSLAGFGAPGSLSTGFTGALPGMQAPNVEQAYATAQKAAYDQWAAEQAQQSAMMQGLFGVGGAVLGGPAGSAIGSGIGGALAGGPGSGSYSGMGGWR